MALSRTEQIVAGAVCLGIIALVLKSGKDKEKVVADGGPPDDQFPQEKLLSIEKELREIIMRVQQVENDARGNVAQWEQEGRLPASPDVMGQVTKLARQLDGLTLRANALFPKLPRDQDKRVTQWQEYKTQTQDHIDRIIRVGENAGRPISVVNNVAHISTVYKDVGGTQNFEQQNLTQNFLQQTFEGPMDIEEHLTINQQQDVRMMNFADGFTNPPAPGAPVGPPAAGGFMQIQDGPRQNDDQQVAVTINQSGLNATGPPAPSQAVQPGVTPARLPDGGGFAPDPKRQQSETSGQLTIEAGFTQAPQSQPTVVPPVAAKTEAPPQVPIGNDIVRIGEAPNFNPSRTELIPHELETIAAERQTYTEMVRDGNKNTTEAKQLKRKIDNREAVEKAAVQLQDRITDPIFMATNKKTDQYFATFDKSLQNEKTDQGRLINKKRWDALRW
jgi:hypothetical protein